MIPHLSHVMTLANSIIGVSVLAMPFCFKQCGIVLAALVLLLSSLLSRLACHFLIKSAVMSRRRNFEFLAFHAFGRSGKLVVELFIIGFLLGTCIAFFVVVGDLGPQIIGKMLNKRPEDIRTSILVTTATFIVFPLGLLRNIDSLSSICTATIGFYLVLVLKVFGESSRHIFLGDWYDRVIYWRPGGILQCLPIFAMALFCQTQLFEIYEAIPNVCLEKMNQVVRGALNICTIVYLCVGFFGYVAFCMQSFTGNILMSFEPSLTSDLIKMGFVFSVAFSFPLVIFPCRASLNSLLFRKAHTHEPSNYYIPEMRFRCLTLTIVALSLGIGILIPNIEFVLGIVGSTIGVMICLIFPAACFIAISTKNTNERLIAQAIVIFGMSIMVLGTYANLYAMEESSSARVGITTGESLDRINEVFDKMPKDAFRDNEKDTKLVQIYDKVDKSEPEVLQKNDENMDVRREPPIPIERSLLTEGPVAVGEKKDVDLAAVTIRPVPKDIVTPGDNLEATPRPSNADESADRKDRPPAVVEAQRIENLIDSDAIKKEESELAAAGDQADIEAAARHEKLRQTLEKHKLEQKKLMQEQKEIVKEFKEVVETEQKRLAKEQQIKKEESVGVEANKLSIQQKIVDDASNQLVAKQEPSNPGNMIKNNEISLNDPPPREVDALPAEKSIASPAISPPEIRPKDSHGPILNALTNRTSRRNETNGKEMNGNEIPRKTLDVALPIALQMRNQTSLNADDKLAPALNDGAGLAMRRDILAKSESDKRDKREIDNREHSSEDESEIKKKPRVEECHRKIEDKSETINIPTTEIINIKTNVYLADQEFTKNEVSLHPSKNAGEDSNTLKKRDFEVVKTEQ